MLPDRVSNPGPLTYESDALPIALRGPAQLGHCTFISYLFLKLSLYVNSICQLYMKVTKLSKGSFQTFRMK